MTTTTQELERKADFIITEMQRLDDEIDLLQQQVARLQEQVAGIKSVTKMLVKWQVLPKGNVNGT